MLPINHQHSIIKCKRERRRAKCLFVFFLLLFCFWFRCLHRCSWWCVVFAVVTEFVHLGDFFFQRFAFGVPFVDFFLCRFEVVSEGLALHFGGVRSDLHLTVLAFEEDDLLLVVRLLLRRFVL